MDRQEAASVVKGVEQRQLLLAVHRVAGVVDVERDRRGRAREGAAEDIDQGSRHARHLAARGRVSPDGSMVGWEQRSRPLSGARPTASLKRGSPRRASQSSASSYPQAIANMRKRSIAGSVWTTRSGSRHSRMQPASASARPSRRSARATGPAASDEIDRPRNRRLPSCG